MRSSEPKKEQNTGEEVVTTTTPLPPNTIVKECNETQSEEQGCTSKGTCYQEIKLHDNSITTICK